MLLALTVILFVFGVITGYLLRRWTGRAGRSCFSGRQVPRGDDVLGSADSDVAHTCPNAGSAGEGRSGSDVCKPAAVCPSSPDSICVLDLLEAPRADASVAIAEETQPDGASLLLEKLRDAADSLQARPALIEALSDSPNNPHGLTDAVLADPALTGQLLKTVNSPFYGLRQPIASAHRAVLYLGHLEVRNLIWKICFSDVFWSTPTPEEEAALEQFWRHSFRASRIALDAARTLGLSQADVYSTAALLHDIGRLIGWRLKPDTLGDGNGKASTLASLAAEQRSWGMTHAALGAEIILHWRLPEQSCEAIRRHHDPIRIDAEVGVSALGPALVHLADTLAHCMGVAFGGRAYPIPGPLDSWWKALGIGGDPNGFCLEVLRLSARWLAMTEPAREAAPSEQAA